MKIATLCLLVRNGQVSLAKKKRGVGEGKWNGYGGKVKIDEGETVERGILREIREECGVEVKEKDLIPAGEVTFYFSEIPKWRVYLFIVSKFEGEPVETKEMLTPEWFDFKNIPYSLMMPSDVKFFPSILGGKRIKAKSFFDKDGNVCEKFVFEEIVPIA